MLAGREKAVLDRESGKGAGTVAARRQDTLLDWWQSHAHMAGGDGARGVIALSLSIAWACTRWVVQSIVCGAGDVLIRQTCAPVARAQDLGICYGNTGDPIVRHGARYLRWVTRMVWLQCQVSCIFVEGRQRMCLWMMTSHLRLWLMRPQRCSQNHYRRYSSRACSLENPRDDESRNSGCGGLTEDAHKMQGLLR